MSQTKRSVYANALWELITRIPHYVKRFPELIRDPVYRSSSFLSLGSIFSIGAGFLFLLVAARSYSVQEVGVATALISALNLVYFAAKLGFDNALIRFFPSEDKVKAVSYTHLTLPTNRAV